MFSDGYFDSRMEEVRTYIGVINDLVNFTDASGSLSNPTDILKHYSAIIILEN